MDNRYEAVSDFYSTYEGEVPSLTQYFDEAVSALTAEGMNTYGRDGVMHIVAGIPGSGKSTYIAENFHKGEYFLVGIDSAREWFLRNDLIPNISWLSKSESSGYYQLFFFEVSEQVAENLMRKGVNLIVDTTFRSYANGMAQAAKVVKHNYACHVTYLDVSIPVAKERVISRYYAELEQSGEGRVIPLSDYANLISYTGEEHSVAGDIFVEVEDMHSESFNSFTRI